MPVNVRRFCTSVLLVLLSSFAIINAQTPQASSEPQPQNINPVVSKAPTSSEIMRDRVSKAKAFIAARNYPSAIYELENIKRETSDPTVHNVVNVLLMNSYLEQGDLRRADEMLKNHFASLKRNNANAETFYQALAAQVVRSARSQIERYRSFGLLVSDRNLPLEAVREIEGMRSMLEAVVEQAKEVSSNAQQANLGIALLEEATTVRAALARDEYDARRWRDEVADARELMATSRSVVKNAFELSSGEPAASVITEGQGSVATTRSADNGVSSSKPDDPKSPSAELVASNSSVTKTEQTGTSAANSNPPERPVMVVGASQTKNTSEKENKPEAVPSSIVLKNENPDPVNVGSLIQFATRQAAPTYPAPARQMRASGVVRVDLIIDEVGEIIEITHVSGHTLLQPAARDAIMKWKFRPVVRDGQPVKATGFITFNFAL
ncbi:energy transducer TonB [Leptolyngbya sp. 7M]|uniref:energy transducer TonB n=1 Tax=Leptolyngbya sp. 7M TaxID=2812896 RepID=UPI001B8B397A|nr:energy transducer TonB [Leptolyngbya sp. 7M]QYO66170.1 TonB family protein [Leptolyngbya sp. 7M]